MKNLIFSIFLLMGFAISASAEKECDQTYDTPDGPVDARINGECIQVTKWDHNQFDRGSYEAYYTAAKYKSKKDCGKALKDTEEEFNKPTSNLNKEVLEALKNARGKLKDAQGKSVLGPLPTLIPAEATHVGCFPIYYKAASIKKTIKDIATQTIGDPREERVTFLLITTLKYKPENTAISDPKEANKLIDAAKSTAQSLP